MKHLTLSILILMAIATSAMASPVVGDLVRFRVATAQYNLAVVGRVVSGTTVDLVAFSDGTTWQDTGTPSNYATLTYYSATPGTGVGQYQPTTIVADVIAAAGFATEAWVSGQGYASQGFVTGQGYATTGYVNTADDARLALPAAPTSAGLTLGGAGVQFSASRPVWVRARGTATMVSTLGIGQAFTVELRCDANTTPTAVVDDDSGAFTDALGVTTSTMVPWKVSTLARAGDRCRVVQSAGSATLALTGSNAQPL